MGTYEIILVERLGTKGHISFCQAPIDYICWMAQQAGHWKLSRDELNGYSLGHIDASKTLL